MTFGLGRSCLTRCIGGGRGLSGCWLGELVLCRANQCITAWSVYKPAGLLSHLVSHAVHAVYVPLCRSYKQVRQRPEFADRSIITMVQQAHHNSSGGGGGQTVSRDLAQLAELDAFMLAEVMAVAQQGYSR